MDLDLEGQIEKWLIEAREVFVRMRMKNTGDSEEVCRAVVNDVLSRPVTEPQSTFKQLLIGRRYYQKRKRAAVTAAQ